MPTRTGRARRQSRRRTRRQIRRGARRPARRVSRRRARSRRSSRRRRGGAELDFSGLDDILATKPFPGFSDAQIDSILDRLEDGDEHLENEIQQTNIDKLVHNIGVIVSRRFIIPPEAQFTEREAKEMLLSRELNKDFDEDDGTDTDEEQPFDWANDEHLPANFMNMEE